MAIDISTKLPMDQAKKGVYLDWANLDRYIAGCIINFGIERYNLPITCN
ncbi:MAG: hypothetical protein ABIN89_22430 [Chitinophagaceae bacterium]